jgi:hypothetical protein
MAADNTTSRLSAWLAGPLKLLDVRPTDAFLQIRLPSARVRNIPAAKIDNNCFELPPRQVPFGLVASTLVELDTWSAWLRSRDWSVSAECSFVADEYELQ